MGYVTLAGMWPMASSGESVSVFVSLSPPLFLLQTWWNIHWYIHMLSALGVINFVALKPQPLRWGKT